MAKRTVLHLRLDPDKLGGSSQGIVGLAQGSKQYACQVEGQKRREERCSSKYNYIIIHADILSPVQFSMLLYIHRERGDCN